MDEIVNLGKKIVCGNKNGVIIFAEYETEERTNEVFEELLRERFPKQCISMSASGVNNIPNMEVYYMPEE